MNKINRFHRLIILIIISIFFSMITDAEDVHITYVSLVDPNLGFYKVTDSTTHRPAPYVDRVLTINQGDNVIWKNDADPSSPVTIVSEQNLFKDIELRLINDVFSYTFNQAGVFTFYVKEREMARQTIIVNNEGAVVNVPMNTPTSNPTITPILTNTPTNTPVVAYASPKNESGKDYKLSVASIASIMVAIISLLMMISTRKR